MASQREEALNTETARLLVKANPSLICEAEKKVGQHDSIDVLVTADGWLIALEAKRLDHFRENTVLRAGAGQALKRVVKGHAQLGAVLVYPEGLTSPAIEDCADLKWAKAVGKGEAGSVQTGSVDELAEWLARLPDEIDSSDAVRLLQSSLSDASLQLSDSERESLIGEFGIPPKNKTGKSLGIPGTIRVLLMVAAATMFHARVQEHLEALPSQEHPPAEPSKGQWAPPDSPGSCRNSSDPVAAFLQAWELILRVDYRPIFEAARAALSCLHGSARWALAISKVTEVALSIASQVPKLRHDLLGSIFHKVLDTARYDGSYYTTTAAATLLAGLAIRSDGCDWSDPDAVARLNICDPACGSGTLLMAAAERISQLRRGVDGVVHTDDNWLLGQLLIEEVLWGYDINPTATHLAATTLGLLAPSVNFRQMNLYETRFGVDQGGVHLGALDLLPSEMAGSVRLAPPPPHKMRQIEADQATEEDEQAAANPPPMDLVIMNPPFTRDSLRHDQLGKTGEAKVKKREKQLLANHLHRGAARLHSSDGMFLLLGEHLSHDENGVLAVVLPAVVATSAGALGRRQFLADKFHIDYVVIPHDPQRIAFSGNTAISEMLVVARRRKPKETPRPTRLVKLLHNPATPLEAMSIVGHLVDTPPESLPSIAAPFIIDNIPYKSVQAGDWRSVVFAAGWLMDELLSLEAACQKIGNLTDIGPAGQRIRDAFTKSPISTGQQAHWDHKANLVTSMNTNPDYWIKPKPGREHLATRYWSRRQRLLLANRLNLPTMRMLAVLSEQPSVGSAFCPVKGRDESHEKALCVWLNSSLGILGAIGNQTLRKLPYPRYSIDDQKNFPAPDFSGDEATQLASAYDTHQKATLLPLKEMANCPTRAQLDRAVANTVGNKTGFDTERIIRIREALSEEPSISGQQLTLTP